MVGGPWFLVKCDFGLRAIGTGWEPTPWHATQLAAWEALRKFDEDSR